jgi:A/G-specific adenine glycosylase
MAKKPTFFSKRLILWYLENKRALPWRNTSEPYNIWLSEIMLQQTRVAQGLPYYLKFCKAFPKVEDLANASEEEVLKLWQGLGYYSRARNLHATAKYVAEELSGVFPNHYKDLLALKGVGDYTASAMASICFNEPTAVVDGNVYRVLSRVFNIDTPINSSQGIKEFKALAQELMDPKIPGNYNQAIMEFGARFCVPQNPDCSSCIFNDKCLAFQKKKVKNLPVKLKKTKVKNRYFNYIVLLSEANKTVLQQRTQKGIWQQLYEFPLIETDSEINKKQLMVQNDYKDLSEKHQIESITKYNDNAIIHKLSHRNLHTFFWIGTMLNSTEKSISIETILSYPVPVLIENFISEFFKKEEINNPKV